MPQIPQPPQPLVQPGSSFITEAFDPQSRRTYELEFPGLGREPTDVEIDEAFEIAKAEAQESAAFPPTAEEASQGLQRAGEIGLDIAKQEALPIALSTAAGFAFPPAGVATGAARLARAAVRMSSVGSANLLGDIGTRGFRGQAFPNGYEIAFDFAVPLGPESAAARLADPAERIAIQELLESSAGVTTRKALKQASGRVKLATLFKEEASRLEKRTRKRRDRLYDRARRFADRRGLQAPPSPDLVDEAERALQIVRRGDPNSPAAKNLQDLVLRGRKGEPVSYSTMSNLNKEISDFTPEYNATVGKKHIGDDPTLALSSKLKRDMDVMAQEEPLVLRAQKAADDFRRGDYAQTMESIRRVGKDNVAPEDIPKLLAKSPSRLKLVMDGLPVEMQDDVRAAWFGQALTRSTTVEGTLDFKKFLGEIASSRLDPEALAILSGNNAEGVNKAAKAMASFVRRQETLDSIFTARNAAYAFAGTTIAASLKEGDLNLAVPALVGTGMGVMVIARVMSNPEALKLFERGLGQGGRLGGRTILQSLTRVGINLAEPSLRTSQKQQRRGRSPSVAATRPRQPLR
jgi:hypothetical protein